MDASVYCRHTKRLQLLDVMGFLACQLQQKIPQQISKWIYSFCFNTGFATATKDSLILCSTWAKKSQRSARFQPSPLRLPRSCVWGSQSNLLDLEPLTEPQERGTADAKEDLQKTAEPHLLQSGGLVDPAAGISEPALEQEQQQRVEEQLEAHEAARKQCQDPAQPEDEPEKARAPYSANYEEARESQSAFVGQHTASRSSPSQAGSSRENAEPNANAAAVAGSLGGGKDPFVRPMEALMSTVAKVGITPAAGLTLGAVATRSRRPKKADSASSELPGNSPAEVARPDQSSLEAIPNPDRVAARVQPGGKHGLNQAGSCSQLDQAADRLDKAATSPVDKEASHLLGPQPAVQMQTPHANLAEQALSGSKRSRRSLAAPQDVCKHPS